MDLLVMDRLREARGSRSRDEIVRLCGISVSALSMYENGQRVPRDEIKVKLANVYNGTVEDLFF